MKNLITIDVGGTSIKYGLWHEEDQRLSDQGQVATPAKLTDFYQVLQTISAKFTNVAGVGMSIPGAVDQNTGVIGGISALPYIHNFPIQKVLEVKLGLPVAMENDANCAALAEVALGAAKDMQNVLFVVIGTGVGGAVVVDRKIVHGHQLYGGEFGMMLGLDNQQLSTVGTAVKVAERYNAQKGTQWTGQQVFELATKGDQSAITEVQKMYANLAHVIYNIQFSTDPEAIIIGGGISANREFINGLNQTLSDLVGQLNDNSITSQEIPITPQVIAAQMHNDANLVGAAYNFYH